MSMDIGSYDKCEVAREPEIASLLSRVSDALDNLSSAADRLESRFGKVLMPAAPRAVDEKSPSEPIHTEIGRQLYSAYANINDVARTLVILGDRSEL